MKITARQAAFDILLKIERDKAYSNLAIDSAVKALRPDSTDCAFISHLVYGVTERKITLDYVISKYLNKPITKLKPEVLTVLRLGAYQLLFSDKIPDSAAVNESVSLAKNNKSDYAAGLINAVLRNISRDGFVIDGSLSETQKISLECSAPEELVSLLTYHYGSDNAKAFLLSSLEPKSITIRVNTLKTTDNELIELLKSEDVIAEKTWLKDAIKIKAKGAVYELEAYKNGLFHVEDISSQLCVRELSVFPGAEVIDVCSAPGGKSFTAAQYMENKGSLISCDLYEQRVDLIKDGAERLGISVLNACVNDASVFNKDFPKADCVLCDVPCSGLGIIGKKPEIKYKPLDDTKALLPIQRKILDVSSGYVKNGGKLLYSTCSVNPNENKKICDAFLNEHPEFEAVKVASELKRVKDEGNYLTLIPHINDCDGFFIAAFRKITDDTDD